MGLEKVKQEILDRAHKEASEVIDGAQAEASAIIKAAEKQVEEYSKLIEDEAEKAADAMKRRSQASAELELRKMSLAAKNGLIEEVFREAGKKLAQLSDKKREAYFTRLLDRAKAEIEVSVVYCNSRDAKFAEGRFKVARNDGMVGGLIAETANGKLRVDYSFDTLLAQVRSKVLSNVATKLFGK